MRIYNSRLEAQFTQPDPIGLAGGLNLYGYANGDPVNFSDPYGLCPECGGRLAAAAAGGRKAGAASRDRLVDWISGQTGSSLGREFAEHFFNGGGQEFVLSPNQMGEVSSTVGSLGGDQSNGSRKVNFYGTDLAGAFGRATVTFGGGSVTQVRDTYDFNPLPLGERPFKAELKTRAVFYIGRLTGAQSYEIRGGG